MTDVPSKGKIRLARFVMWLVSILSIFALLRFGLSPQARQTFWQDILSRPGGPMTFRFILQPAMAVIAALVDGIKDARAGRSPYLWTVLTDPAKRMGRLNEGVISTARIILLGLVMDAIYQFIVLKTFNPGQAVIVALVLAFFPYVLLRGPIARVVRRWRGGAALSTQGQHHDR